MLNASSASVCIFISAIYWHFSCVNIGHIYGNAGSQLSDPICDATQLL